MLAFLIFASIYCYKQLKTNKTMKGKSLLTMILSAAVLAFGAYSGYFNDTVQAWLGVLSAAIIIVLNSDMMKSGDMTKGWTWATWALNISAIAVQVGGMIGEKALMPATIVNGIIIGINIFIQVIAKDYGQGSLIHKKA